MAIMHPKDIENYTPTPSEKQFYYALQKQLADKFQVFYSVRWFETIDNKRVDSESDFIIFDPSFGFLAIEVKGGVGIVVDDETWTLIEDSNNSPSSKRVLKCSPYVQAEKSMRHFYNYFYQEFNQSFNGVYGFAVAFPRFALENKLNSSAPTELTIDASNMEELPKKINSIFHYWRNKRNLKAPFSSEQRTRFINSINKRISLSAAAGALIPIKEQEFSAISFVQDSVLDTLYNYHQVQIVGGAGTGKTFIGIKKVIRDAAEGKKVLFICRSRELSHFVKQKFPQRLAIDCFDYENLMEILLGQKYYGTPLNSNGNHCCFDLISTIGMDSKYDSIIVDEAQDFDVDMGLSIRALLKNDRKSTLYVFYDRNQNIFSQNFENAFAIDYPPFVLRYNIRNTGCIYKCAIEMTNLGKETIANNLIGVEPEYTEYKNQMQARKSLTNIVNRLVRKEFVPTSSVVILSDMPFEKSILAEETSVGAYKIVFCDPKKAKDNEVCFKTAAEFKGLEADVVIFLMHSLEGMPISEQKASNQYVAITRARYYLYILNTIDKA